MCFYSHNLGHLKKWKCECMMCVCERDRVENLISLAFYLVATSSTTHLFYWSSGDEGVHILLTTRECLVVVSHQICVQVRCISLLIKIMMLMNINTTKLIVLILKVHYTLKKMEYSVLYILCRLYIGSGSENGSGYGLSLLTLLGLISIQWLVLILSSLKGAKHFHVQWNIVQCTYSKIYLRIINF